MVYWKLAAITALGACLRLYRLDHQSLWHDEAASLTVGTAPFDRILQMLNTTSPGYFYQLHAGTSLAATAREFEETNPPAYFYALHAWFDVFGVGGFQARLLSAVMGFIAIPLIFLLARHLYDATTGLYAALLLAVSQRGVMYSQEARNYEAFLVLFVATAYCYALARSRRSLAAWCCCTACAVLMVATHFYGVFAIAALAIHTVICWRTIPMRWIAGAAAAGCVALWPLFRPALTALPLAAPDVMLPSYFSVGPSTLVSVMNRFNNGATAGLLNPAPDWTLLAGGILFGGPLMVGIVRTWSGVEMDRGRRCAMLFAGLLWLIPLLSLLAFSALLNIQFDIRYVAFTIAPYYVLVAVGLASLPRRTLQSATAVAIVAYSGYALTANYYVPYKENYRDAIAFVAGQAEPADCYAFVPFGSPPLVWPIYTSIVPRTLLNEDQEPLSVWGCRRIWVITYRRVMLDAHTRWQKWLSAATASYTKGVERQFFWIRVERYDKPASG